MEFNRLTDSHVDSLRAIVGEKFVLTDDESLKIASCDETEDLCFTPDIVVRPGSANEISEILKLASREKIPVTPRGGGTGLSGGALPVYGGIVLLMDRFDKILEIDSENFFAVVEAGVITQNFRDEVEKVGLFYPPDPASRGSCFIGGNIAENSGGPRAMKYGVTKDWVYGLEVVLPNGDIIDTGGKLIKNVAGYNLSQIFVGSEGTLGIVTKATMRLIAKPKFSSLLLCAFDDPFIACSTVVKMRISGIAPSACEFLERDALEMAGQHLEKKIPNVESAAQLLIEIDGNDEDRLSEEVERAGAICHESGSTDILIADTGAKVTELWEIRTAVGEAVKAHSVYKEEDTVVPPARLPDLYVGVKKICAVHGVRSVCYGHAGDGNLHVNLLKDMLSDSEWKEKLPPAIEEIFAHCVSLGGTISGEHGIGWSQKPWLHLALSEAEFNLMRAIKKALDPNGILNPGKVFDM
ncbi:MAG: FAD-linked oxidase C-terminal domain-containing protein [bacterium]